MMRLALALAFVSALAIAAPAAEEKAVSNYEHLKVLEPFFGPWVYEGPAKDEIPGLAEKGAAIRIPFEYRWVLDKNGIVMDWSIQVRGGKSLSGMVLIGWNAKEKRITSCQLTSAGFCASSVWFADGKTLRIEGKEIGPDGVETSSVVFNKLTDRGTMIWQATNVLRDGEKQPDSPEFELRPRKR